MATKPIHPKQSQTPIVLGVMVFISIAFIGFLFLSSNEEDKSKKIESTDTLVESVNDGFSGDIGVKVSAAEGVVEIDETEVSDGNMHSYNYYSEEAGKNIYFFIVEASDGTYRAAANACEVCHATKKGFTQVGDKIKCNNCGTTYSKDQIALQKGGCNPVPINADVNIVDGVLVLDVSDIEAVADLF